MSEPVSEPTMAQLKEILEEQQEEIDNLRGQLSTMQSTVEDLTKGLRTVAWLHHELVFGMKLAAAKRALSAMDPNQLATILAQRA